MARDSVAATVRRSIRSTPTLRLDASNPQHLGLLRSDQAHRVQKARKKPISHREQKQNAVAVVEEDDIRFPSTPRRKPAYLRPPTIPQQDTNDLRKVMFRRAASSSPAIMKMVSSNSSQVSSSIQDQEASKGVVDRKTASVQSVLKKFQKLEVDPREEQLDKMQLDLAVEEHK